MELSTKAETLYLVECYDAEGRLKWSDTFHNLVTTAGLNDYLDKTLKGSSYTAAWYVGLTSSSPTAAAADTMSSHAGWTEVTDYDEASRQTLSLGSVSAGSVNNSASKAVFTINATVTVGGAFVVSNSTKSGTTGTLLGIGAFTGGNRSVVDNDVINVTVTASISAA